MMGNHDTHKIKTQSPEAVMVGAILFGDSGLKSEITSSDLRRFSPALVTALNGSLEGDLQQHFLDAGLTDADIETAREALHASYRRAPHRWVGGTSQHQSPREAFLAAQSALRNKSETKGE